MKHNIDHILDNYWAGESTVEDEVLLKDYFKSGEIQEKHELYKELFVFFSEQNNITYQKENIVIDYSRLLDKYWDGETSEDEEFILKVYFCSGNVQEEHKVFVDLFEYFDTQKSITFNSQQSKSIDVKPKIKYFSFRKIIYSIAAASVLLFAAVTVMKDINPDPTVQQTAMVYEIEDPEEALRVTKEALALVSKKFRASQQTVRENMGSLEKAAIFK
ncbi:MAG: hypothetical protein KA270_12135 [Saprospiraceae bacterium]|nr:hypothetical protein [Saprospiraceae bacterium]MBP6567911.1 hypothetical protein [Saprospiraceae bacterium]